MQARRRVVAARERRLRPWSVWGLALAVLMLAALGLPAWHRAAGTFLAAPCAHGATEVPTLRGGVLHESAALALPTRLEVVGDYLVVIDAGSDSALHVVNRRTGALVRSLGRRGEGPGEFTGAWSLDARAGPEPTVWVYDLSLRRLTLLALDGEASVAPGEVRMVRFVDGAVLTSPRWIDAATILSAGLLPDARAAMYDSAGRRLRTLGQPPFPDGSAQPVQALQARLVRHPRQPVFAATSRYTSRLDVIDVASGSVKTVAGPVPVNLPPQPVALDRFAYIDVAATAPYIVALFSGRERGGGGAPPNFGRCLQVFDWAGTFIGAFRLDSDVLAVAAEDDARSVYALRHDPWPAVLHFPLPPLAHARMQAGAP